MMLALLEPKDLLSCIHEGEKIPNEHDPNRQRATFIIKKYVSKEVCYLVRNLKRPGNILEIVKPAFCTKY